MPLPSLREELADGGPFAPPAALRVRAGVGERVAPGAVHRGPPECVSPLPIGSRVAGRYRVLALLEGAGEPSACVAVDARSSGARRWVVLEAPRAEQRHARGVDAFVADARLRQRMRHPHLLEARELAWHEGLPVLVTEYVEGESLATLLALARPEFSLELRLGVLAAALRGLRHIHQLRDADGRPLSLVHAGLSLHDVLVGDDGSVKLGGFGATTAAARCRRSAAIAPCNLEYLAPEQLRGPSLPASDVFAAGVMLWELAALERFWSDLPEYEIRRRLLVFDIPDVARLKPSVGGELGRICRKALSGDPRRRHASAAELLDDLERYLLERAPLAASAPPAPVVAPVPSAALQRLMLVACGERRAASRRVLDAALAAHAGRSASGRWPLRGPASTTALWAAGMLGAFSLAVAAPRLPSMGEIAAGGEPRIGAVALAEPRWLAPGEHAPLHAEAPAVDRVGAPGEPAPAGPEPPDGTSALLRALLPEAPGEHTSRAEASSASGARAGRSERARADADARARRLRRAAGAEHAEAIDDVERTPRDGRALTIRLER